jgi:hypothetical protein
MIAYRPFKAGTVALAAVLAAATLSSCSDARRALGYDKAPPDEFAVVARAPLAQPPDYNLRPPAPGAPRPQEGTTTEQARAALLPGKNGVSPVLAGTTKGEQFLLTKSGADKATPDIRRVVNEETSNMVEADNSFVDKLMFWQDKAPPGDIVNAGAEAKRLKDNAASGKPATEGKTVIIERKSSSWFDWIL